MKIIAKIYIERHHEVDKYYIIDLENGKIITIRVMDDYESGRGLIDRADVVETETPEDAKAPEIVKLLAARFLEDDKNTYLKLEKPKRIENIKNTPKEEWKTGADDIGGIYDAKWY